jgi:hypothetical protein
MQAIEDRPFAITIDLFSIVAPPKTRTPMPHKFLARVAIAILAAPATLVGQTPRDTSGDRRAPDKNATHIMISAFASAERGPRPLGAKAAEEMRSQVAQAFSPKLVYVIPRERMFIPSGHGAFPVEEPLEHPDVKALATMLRAHEYVLGAIERTSNGEFRAQADLVLTRDINARQPLGVGESQSIADAIKVLVREMKEARKQMDGEKKCVNAVREGKHSEAIEFARAAIALYPKATLARLCLLNALAGIKAPADNVVKIAAEVVALDPRNNLALEYLAAEQRRRSQRDSLQPFGKF